MSKLRKSLGFYIVLLSCLTIVGVTGYITKVRIDNQRLTQQYQAELEKSRAVTAQHNQAPDMVVDVERNLPTITPSSIVTPQPTKTPQAQETKPQPKAAQPISQSAVPVMAEASPKIPTFFPPVEGEIITPFSKDQLIYSKTLDDWRTHGGVDIRSELGAKVHASADGFIEDALNHPEMGLTIIINHGGGYKSVYSNLSTLDLVTSGQVVKGGDLIGAVGDTSLLESGEEPHLHFEILLDGNQIKPEIGIDEN